MSYESNLSNIILRLKQAKDNQPGLTLQKISDHTGVSLTTVTRVFSPDSESHYFKYESIQPIANMLLGLNDLDEGNVDEQALKAIIRFQDSALDDLKAEINVLKKNYETKIGIIEKQHKSDIDYYRNQCSSKDEVISRLLSRIEHQDDIYSYLNKQYIEIMSSSK